MSYPNPKNIVHVTNADIADGRTKHVTQAEIGVIQDVSGFKAGMVVVSSGATSLTVTGLALTGTPTFLNVSLIRPASNSPLVFASVSMDTVTTNGFTADFSSSVPQAGYYLSYILKV